MELIFDSGVQDGQSSSNWRQVKTYKVEGQLFKIEVSSYQSGEYNIYRFSQDGEWKWIEAKGGSFVGNPHISTRGTRHQDGTITKATWEPTWDYCIEQVLEYASITKPYRESN